jgi:hypothetical protein
MINKSFLSSVLAFVAIGVAARADVVPYCDGFCGSHDIASFNSALALAGYTYVSDTDLVFGGSLSDAGLQYLDAETNVMFAASSAFMINGVTLETAASKALTISVPAAYGAIQLVLSQPGGGSDTTFTDSFDDSVNLSSTLLVLDYLNTTPGSNWTITLTPNFPGEQITVNGFDPAGVNMSSTPEVGTLLLIGSGLIAMRYVRRARSHFFRTPQTA